MNKGLECININWEVLGAQLARMSDEEQAPFLKAFAREMLKYPSHYQTEMQLTYIREHDKYKLTDREREIYTTLGWKEIQS